MALYTTLEAPDFSQVAEAFGLGVVGETKGIPQGSINTNYRLKTDTGLFFLRHTTVRSPEDLWFEYRLLLHLHESAFPAPHMLATLDGAPFLPLKDGRACVFRFLAGEELQRGQVTQAHCERLGRELGKYHRLALSFAGQRSNPYRREVVEGWLKGLRQRPEPEVSAAAAELQDLLQKVELSGLLPRGVIHADLFLDNVKWVGDHVSAFFDFEMACVDAFMLDLAITLNAWCFSEGYLWPLCRALVRGYCEQRELSLEERAALWSHLLFGAIRYTASRIRDFHLSPLPDDQLFKKDYRTYLNRARQLAQLTPSQLQRELGL